MSDEGPRRLRTGRFGRATMLGGLAANLAKDAAGAAARLASQLSAEAGAAAFHSGAARSLASSLGKMKGLPMKVGQMLSYIDDFIPPEHRVVYRDTLRALQTHTSPLSFQEIERVIREDLGKGPDEVFARFDRKPIAAASIGQVYRAALSTGEEVAVKVQYPGIAEAIKSDLQNIDTLRSTLSLIIPKLDVEQTLGDITARLFDECDYRAELANQQAFHDFWAGDVEAYVPRPFADLSGPRVLVTEFLAGKNWHDMIATATPAEKSRYGRIIFRFAFRPLFVAGMFNGDPHPGNYVFMPDGRVGFLDFGCVQRYSRKAILDLTSVRHGLFRGIRGRELSRLAIAGYGLPQDMDAELEKFVEQYVLASFEPLLSPQPYRYTRAITEKIMEMTFEAKKMVTKRMLRQGVWESKQEGFVFINRINFGLNSLLAELGSCQDWPALLLAIDEEAGLIEPT